MTDLELTKLCAEAMELHGYVEERLATSLGQTRLCRPEMDRPKGLPEFYRPLHDDAQAMALVKLLGLMIMSPELTGEWEVRKYELRPPQQGSFRICSATHKDLNRAIVLCVAKMQEQTRD